MAVTSNGKNTVQSGLVNTIVYDTEATGLDTNFDQILQIAAIAYDANGREIETLNLRCRRMNHIVPSVMALAVTKVNPASLDDPSLPSHAEMMLEFEAFVQRHSPALIMGFNNLEFDEPIVRQGLYQALTNPYLTNTPARDGLVKNRRADVLRMAHATYMFAPNALKVGETAKGNPSFRLGVLSEKNSLDFDKSQAHDALYDTRLTHAVAKLLKAKAEPLIRHMIALADPEHVRRFVTDHKVFAEALVAFGKPHAVFTTHVTVNPMDRHQAVLFDLALPVENYLTASVSDLAANLSDKKTYALRKCRFNRQPILVPEKLVADTLAAGGNRSVAPETRHLRADILRQNPHFGFAVGLALLESDYDIAGLLKQQTNHDHALQSYFDAAPLQDKFNAIQAMTNSGQIIRNLSRLYNMVNRLPVEERNMLLPLDAADNCLKAALEKQPPRSKYDSPNAPVEKQIYQSFPTAQDRAQMAQFHLASWTERYYLAQQFNDTRYRTLAERMLYEKARTLSPEQRDMILPAEIYQKHDLRSATHMLGDETAALRSIKRARLEWQRADSWKASPEQRIFAEKIILPWLDRLESEAKSLLSPPSLQKPAAKKRISGKKHRKGHTPP